MSKPWKEEQSCRKEYEKDGSDTAFADKFLEIVREVYGKDFDFSACIIERGPIFSVVTFGRHPDSIAL